MYIYVAEMHVCVALDYMNDRSLLQNIVSFIGLNDRSLLQNIVSFIGLFCIALDYMNDPCVGNVCIHMLQECMYMYVAGMHVCVARL